MTLTSKKDFFDYIVVIIPLILTCFAVYYTRSQTKISEMKRKDDLYIIRYEVFKKIIDFMQKVNLEQGGHYEIEELAKEIHLNRFLFPEDIDFFESLIGKYREFSGYKNNGTFYIGPDNNYGKISDFFFTELPQLLEKKFEKYLRVK